MENLSESDANILQSFGRGQGIVSGQAVRFPLLVQVKFDDDLVSEAIGDEDFIQEARDWTPKANRAANAEVIRQKLEEPRAKTAEADQTKERGGRKSRKTKATRRGAINPQF